MKIAMIASTYPRYKTDGAARFNHSIAEALAGLGHEVHVIVPYSPLITPFETPVHIHVFRYVWPARLSLMGYAQAMHSDRRLKGVVPLLAPLFFLMGLRKLWQICQKHNIDLIHAHWVIPNGFIAAIASKLTGKPLFISLHGSDIFFARRNKFLGRLAAWTFRRAKGITACSPELYEGALALQAEAETLHLLPWGADPDLFNQSNRAKVGCLRDKLGLTEQHQVLLGLGRLVGKKGFAHLIEAFAQLQADYPQVRLIIGGEGPELSALQAKAAALNLNQQVIFAGNVAWSEVPAYLSLSDIFVAASVYDNGNVDGLPTVILEAMAAGKPVVASDVGGISLVVEPGVNGYLVPAGDVSALAASLAELLQSEDKLTAYGQKSRELVERRFTWKNVAQSFIEMYEQRDITLEVSSQ